MSEDQVTTEVKADTVAGQDATVTMTPEAAAEAAKAAEKAKEPTAQDKLNVLLARSKEYYLTTREELEMRRLKKQIKMGSRARAKQRTMVEKYFLEPQKKKNAKLMKQVEVAKSQIGRKNFQMLRDLFTVPVNEQKDETGKIIQPASSYVNYEGLIAESKNVIVIQREERINSGKRKRSTGRSSDRKAHKGALSFLLNRNQEAAKETAKP